jgi:hypothetical protein
VFLHVIIPRIIKIIKIIKIYLRKKRKIFFIKKSTAPRIPIRKPTTIGPKEKNGIPELGSIYANNCVAIKTNINIKNMIFDIYSSLKILYKLKLTILSVGFDTNTISCYYTTIESGDTQLPIGKFCLESGKV